MPKPEPDSTAKGTVLRYFEVEYEYRKHDPRAHTKREKVGFAAPSSLACLELAREEGVKRYDGKRWKVARWQEVNVAGEA